MINNLKSASVPQNLEFPDKQTLQEMQRIDNINPVKLRGIQYSEHDSNLSSIQFFYTQGFKSPKFSTGEEHNINFLPIDTSHDI